MITSRQNQRLKDIRRLRRCKDARALIEGPKMLAEAVAAGHAPVMALATPEWLAQAEHDPELVALLQSLPEPPAMVDPRLLAEFADADSPRGLLAVVDLPREGVGSLPVVENGVYVFVDAIQDPGNLGALARSAEAAGAVGLALGRGCVHPNHPRALRGSAGSLLRLPVALDVEPTHLERALSKVDAGRAAEWLALATRGGESLWQAPLDGVLILAVGAEGAGLSEELEQRATRALTIPLSAPVESLNATVAASLVLFEIQRRRLCRSSDPSIAQPGGPV